MAELEPPPKEAKKQKREYSDKQIGEALLAHRGLQYLAADALGINYCHMSERINASEYLLKIREQACEKRIDIAEQKLSELQEEKNATSLIFFLKTKGKKRGYTEDDFSGISPEALSSLANLMTHLKHSQEKKD